MINQDHTSDDDVYYNRDRPSIVALVAEGPNRILDLGCGAGAVGRKLLSVGKASEIVGVELFPSAAEQASKHYRRVHTGDIEEMDLPYGCEFDYVLCGDILEHLKDPYSVVRRIGGWLKDEGHFICSVPNVRYWEVLWNLAMRGKWDYCDAGIMDRTHLRFFTKRSCFRMIEDGGFSIERSRILISGRRYKLMNAVSFGLLEEFMGPQTVVLARKKAARSTTAESTPSAPRELAASEYS
jgi:2-polyprenyl-3-methyl-5-hydroxy-6-metoxy-1,4-benzoquinol methylase